MPHISRYQGQVERQGWDVRGVLVELQEHLSGLLVTTVNSHVDGDTVSGIGVVGIDLQDLVEELKRLLVKLLFLSETIGIKGER